MERKKSIKFFKNHNMKLGCDYFTTIRPLWDYYSKGEFYIILLEGKFHCEAQIINLRSFYLNTINDYISFLDAGVSPEQFKEDMRRMYPKKDLNKEPLLFLLLKKIK